MKMSYVGIKPCGCLVGIVSADAPQDIISSATSKWIRAGLAVGYIDTEKAKQDFTECTHDKRFPPTEPAKTTKTDKALLKLARWNAMAGGDAQ